MGELYMEMKYNSLKEALPSLLEAGKTLNENISQLKGLRTKADSDIANLEAQIADLDRKITLKEELIARAKQIEAIKEKQRKLEIVKRALGVQIMMLNSLNLLMKKSISVNKFYADFLRKATEIERKCSKANKLLGEVLTLCRATHDISLIANMNFKQTFPNHQHLFDATFNDMLDTNSLAWIYKFSKNNNDSLSEENMHNLVTSAIKTNIPAYMYLMAIKIDNIPDEDMMHLIAAIVASNDKKYIDCLLLDLYKKGVSEEVRNYITSLNISIDMGTMFGYNGDLAAELGKALLEDNLEVLYKHGMYSYEDRAYVLSNIQAGL